MSSILIRICDSFLVLFINVRDKQGNKLTYRIGEATNCKRIKPHIILNDERLVEKVLYLCASVISFSLDYDSKLPIVLFVGQHFSGSLFHLITLLLFTQETTKGTRVRDLQPLTLSLRFSPSWLPLSLPTPVPRWGVG